MRCFSSKGRFKNSFPDFVTRNFLDPVGLMNLYANAKRYSISKISIFLNSLPGLGISRSANLFPVLLKMDPLAVNLITSSSTKLAKRSKLETKSTPIEAVIDGSTVLSFAC